MGSPNKAGTHDVHGAALGAAEVAATREALGWTAAPFEIPADIAASWNAVATRCGGRTRLARAF
jgi:transketolase